MRSASEVDWRPDSERRPGSGPVDVVTRTPARSSHDRVLPGIPAWPGCASSLFVTRRGASPRPRCRATRQRTGGGRPFPRPAGSEAFLDELEERTFRFFWETRRPDDRARRPTAGRRRRSRASPRSASRSPPTRSASSAAGSRATQARERDARDAALLLRRAAGPGRPAVSRLPRLLLSLPRHGRPGTRFEQVELSTIDTALLLAGALFCQSYFDATDAGEARDPRARRLALPPRRLDAGRSRAPPALSPWLAPRGRLHRRRLARLQRGDAPLRARARLADPPDRRRRRGTAWTADLPLGRPSTARSTSASRRSSATSTRTSGSTSAASATRYMRGRGHRLLRELAPRDARAARVRDRQSRAAGAATAPTLWGLTACDGPVDVDARRSTARRGASAPTPARGVGTDVRDDGTIAPTAAGVVDALRAGDRRSRRSLAMRERYGDAPLSAVRLPRRLQSDASTFDASPCSHGQVVPGVGWFDTDYLGIDQGPILAMIENYRTELVWEIMRKNPHVARGLRRAGLHRRLAGRAGVARDGRARRCAGAPSPAAGRRLRRAGRRGDGSGPTAPLLGDGPRGRGGAASWCRVRARAPRRARAGAADPVERGAREAAHRLRRRRRCPTSRSSATPGSRSSSRSARSRRSTRRIADLGGASTRATTSPASGTPTSIDGARLRRALVRRHARALLSHATCSRAAGYAAPPRDLGRVARGDGARSRRAAAPSATPILLPLNEWEPPVDPRPAARRDAARATATATATSASPRFRRALRLLPRPLRSAARAAASAQRRSRTSTRTSPTATSRCSSAGPWNLGEFARRLPPELAGRVGDGAAARGRDGRRPGRLARRRREPGRCSRGSRAPGRGLAAGSSSSPRRAQQARFYAPDRRPAGAPLERWRDAGARRRPARGGVLAPARRARAPRRRSRSGSASRPRSREHAEAAVRGDVDARRGARRARRATSTRILEKRRWLLDRGGRSAAP